MQRTSEEVGAEAERLVEEASVEFDRMKAEIERVRARTPYPRFCRHPEKCCNTGRCQGERVCNE